MLMAALSVITVVPTVVSPVMASKSALLRSPMAEPGFRDSIEWSVAHSAMTTLSPGSRG